MLTLYLLRHAKSSWEDSSLADHERPLAPRGERAARAMAEHLEKTGVAFARIFCSSAARARQTCDLALAGMEATPETTHELYMATPGEMLSLLQREAGADAPVILVGHNPGMEDFAQAMIGLGDERLLDRMARKYPTGALTEIRFDADRWSQVTPGSGTLVSFTRPKDLPEAEEKGL